MAIQRQSRNLTSYGPHLAVLGCFLMLLISALLPLFIHLSSTGGGFSYIYDFSLFVLPFLISPFFIAILMTLDIWHANFDNFLFRYHLVFILAILLAIPTFIITLLRGPGLGALYFIPSVLLLIGLIFSLIEHSNRRRGPYEGKRLAIVFYFSLVIILGVSLIFVHNSLYYKNELLAVTNNFLAYARINKKAVSSFPAWEQNVSENQFIGNERINTASTALGEASDYSLAPIENPNFSKEAEKFPIYPWHENLINAQDNLFNAWLYFDERNNLVFNKKTNDRFTVSSAKQWSDLTKKMITSEDRTLSLLLKNTNFERNLKKLNVIKKLFQKQHATN